MQKSLIGIFVSIARQVFHGQHPVYLLCLSFSSGCTLMVGTISMTRQTVRLSTLILFLQTSPIPLAGPGWYQELHPIINIPFVQPPDHHNVGMSLSLTFGWN